MVAMKKNLLTVVQTVLDELGSDQVSSITDTEEANMIARMAVSTYFDLIANRVVPEHMELIKLTASGDNTLPTLMTFSDNVEQIKWIKYNKSTDGSTKDFQEVYWKEPTEFSRIVDARDSSASTVTTVVDPVNSVNILIFNDRHPQYWTMFDDYYIHFDSYKSSVDSTLQTSKTSAWAKVVPEVSILDTTTFDMDSNYFPYLERELISRCAETLTGAMRQKAEQWARRHKSSIIAHKHRVEKENMRNKYGR